VKYLKNPKVLLILAISIGLAVFIRMRAPVPLPHIQLPAETLFVLPGNIPFTNTLAALLLADVLLLLMALVVRRQLALVPGGLANVIEAVVEFWQDQGEQLVGAEQARRWLPLALTLFLLIGAANWSGLIPGFDYVGIGCHECPHAEGTVEIKHTHFLGKELGPFFFALVRAPTESAHEPASEGVVAEAQAAIDHLMATVVPGEPAEMAVVPFFRPANTDLNLTLALALISFVVIQYAGIRALGAGGYIGKFLNFKEGGLGIFVGLVEAISELSRIISFSFRLFGNIFAGMILLFVIPFLIPLFVPLLPIGLEMFVGLIQAYVFAVLTLAFIAGAVTPHHHPGEEHH
jgi:F-type H+-transporting ATPase subunit a